MPFTLAPEEVLYEEAPIATEPPPEQYVEPAPEQYVEPAPEQTAAAPVVEPAAGGGFQLPPEETVYEAAPQEQYPDQGGTAPATGEGPGGVPPAPPGPFTKAADAVGGYVAENIVDPVREYVPEPVGAAIDSFSGWVPPVTDVTAALGQGDLGGALDVSTEYANRPFEYGTQRQAERAMAQEGQVPSPGEILDDPSKVWDVVPGWWNTGGPGAAAVGTDLDEFAKTYEGDASTLYEDWKASGGLQPTPAGVDSPIDDEVYSGDKSEMLGQIANEVGQFGGSVRDSARSGQLTPFLKGVAVDIGNDPSFAGQVGLGLLTGGTGWLAGAAGRAGLPAAQRLLSGITTAGRAANTTADVVLDPVLSGIPEVGAAATHGLIKGIPAIGKAFQPSTSTINDIQGERVFQTVTEALPDQRANAALRSTPYQVTPPTIAPAGGITSPTPTADPFGDAFSAAPVPRRPANTIYAPTADQPGPVPGQPGSPSPTREVAPRPDPYLRRMNPELTAARTPTIPASKGSPLVSPSTGSPMTPTGGHSPEAIQIQGGRWRNAAGQELVQNNTIVPAARPQIREAYHEMMVAPPEDFWARFDSKTATADVPLGDDGHLARMRGAMKQGLYLLDDWPERRAVEQLKIKEPAGTPEFWNQVLQLSQGPAGDKSLAARRALAGKRNHDLFVHRIAGAVDPDREVFNMVVNYHLDMHGGRFDRERPIYWQQRAEAIQEILRDVDGYEPSGQLLETLRTTDLADLITTEFPDRPMRVEGLRGKTLADGNGIVMHPKTGQPIRFNPPARDAFIAALPEFKESLRTHLNDRGMQDVAIKLIDDIRRVNPAAPYGAEALFRGEEKIVYMSADAALHGRAMPILDHEMIHALRYLELFTENEWHSLVQAAEAMGLRAETERLYRNVPGADIQGEMVAKLNELVGAGASIPELPRSVLQRIWDFLRGFVGAYRDTYPPDVLEAIATGKIGTRGPTRAPYEGPLRKQQRSNADVTHLADTTPDPISGYPVVAPDFVPPNRPMEILGGGVVKHGDRYHLITPYGDISTGYTTRKQADAARERTYGPRPTMPAPVRKTPATQLRLPEGAERELSGEDLYGPEMGGTQSATRETSSDVMEAELPDRGIAPDRLRGPIIGRDPEAIRRLQEQNAARRQTPPASPAEGDIPIQIGERLVQTGHGTDRQYHTTDADGNILTSHRTKQAALSSEPAPSPETVELLAREKALKREIKAQISDQAWLKRHQPDQQFHDLAETKRRDLEDQLWEVQKQIDALPYDQYMIVHHGSPTQGLRTLRADSPAGERNYPNPASTLGAFSSPDWGLAADYSASSRSADAGMFSQGSVYTADVDLKNPYFIDYSEFADRFIDKTTPEAYADAAAFKADLVAKGHDGIHVVGRDIPGQEMGMPEIAEVISFADVPVQWEDRFDGAGGTTYHEPDLGDQFSLTRNQNPPDADINPPEPTAPPVVGRMLGEDPRALFRLMPALREQPGPGLMGITQADLDAAFATADANHGGLLSKLASEGHKSVDGTLVPFDVDLIGRALSAKWSDLLWYEEWTDNIMRAFQMATEGKNRVLNVIAAHSLDTAPKLNMIRGLATAAEWAQGRIHGAMGKVANTTVQKGLLDPHLGSLKQYSFAQTPKFISGMSDTPPGPTLDARVAESLGFLGKKKADGTREMANALLGDGPVYDALADYFTEVTDVVNRHLAVTNPELANLQSWNMQSALWTEYRRTKGTTDGTNSSFIDELPIILAELQEKGIAPPPGGVVTDEWLRTPGLVEALSPNSPSYIGAPSTLATMGKHPADAAMQRMREMTPERRAGDKAAKVPKVPQKALNDYEAINKSTREAIDARVASAVFSAVTGRQSRSMQPRLESTWNGEPALGVKLSGWVRQYKGAGGAEVRHTVGPLGLDYLASIMARETKVPSVPIMSMDYVAPGAGNAFQVYLPRWTEMTHTRTAKLAELEKAINGAGYEVYSSPLEYAGQALYVHPKVGGDAVNYDALSQHLSQVLDLGSEDVRVTDMMISRRDITAAQAPDLRRQVEDAIAQGYTEGTGNVAAFGPGEFAAGTIDASKHRFRADGTPEERLALLDYAESELRTILTDTKSAKDAWYTKNGHLAPPDDQFSVTAPGGAEPGASQQPFNVDTSFAHLPARHRNELTAMLGGQPGVLGPDIVPGTVQTQAALDSTLQFRDTATSQIETKTLRQKMAETQEEVDRWVQLATDSGSRGRAADAEFERLHKKFTSSGYDVNPADLAGAHNADRRDLIVAQAVEDAYNNAKPKKADATGAIKIVGDTNSAYLNFRRKTQLYNILNIPRFMIQQHLGNPISALAKGKVGVAVKGLFGSIPDYPRYFQALQNPGKVSYRSDDLQRKMGAGHVKNVTQSNVASLNLDMRDGKAIGAGSLLDMAGNLLAPKSSVNLGKINDVLIRDYLFEDGVNHGFHKTNAELPRMVSEWSEHYGLPYTPNQVKQVVRDFQSANRTMIDSNTGKPYTTLFGRVQKGEPVYAARDLVEHLSRELPALQTPDPTAMGLMLRRVGADLSHDIKIIQANAVKGMTDVSFDWQMLNIDEALQKVFMYHYWTSRAGLLYAGQALKHPFVFAAYGRMMEDFENEAVRLDAPPWMTGFFQFMNTMPGMSIWYSPMDLFSTLLTFADWQHMEDDPFFDLTWLGKARNNLPFMLNPMLDMVAYVTGAYGPDASPADFLGVNRMQTMAADAINLFNAEGHLGWANALGIGVDAAGNPVPIPVRPLQELYARVGAAMSGALKEVTNLEPVRVPEFEGSYNRDIQYHMEQKVRMDNPELGQDEVNRRVTQGMYDHGSELYQYAYRMRAKQPYVTGDTPLPAWVEGAARLISPIQIQASPEQMMLDSRMKGLEPSGALPERNIGPHGADATEAENEAASYLVQDAKKGASRTLPARQLAQDLSDFYDERDPEGIGAANGGYNNIRYAAKNGTADDVTIGGVDYTGDELAGMDEEVLKDLGAQYLSDQGVSFDQMYAFRKARDEVDERVLGENPVLAGYWEFSQTGKYYPEESGGSAGYIEQAMAMNPAYADYIMQNSVYDESNAPSPEMIGTPNPQYAFTTDAYLASQGIAPSVYTSPVDVPIDASGMISPDAGYTGESPVAGASGAQPVRSTETVNLRAEPGPEGQVMGTIGPDFPGMTLLGTDGEWSHVDVGDGQGWVATEYLMNEAGSAVTAPVGADGSGLGGVLSGVGDAVGSLVDAAGAVVGTMFGIGTPHKPPADGSGRFDVVPANDGMGVQSTEQGSDRTWMENMIGPGLAAVSVDYKGPTPAGVSYEYQNGHAADGTTHAAYDIGCTSPPCNGVPMMAPVSGRVICAGYGAGTGEALGSPQCTYSQNTTTFNDDGSDPAHTIVLDIGTDAAGNALQLSFNHMGTSTVKPGQTVNAGDQIGGMGNGDCDSGPCPHVHLEGWGMCPSTGTYVILDPQLMVGGYYQDHPVC